MKKPYNMSEKRELFYMAVMGFLTGLCAVLAYALFNA